MKQISVSVYGATVVHDARGNQLAVPGVKPVRIVAMLALQQGVPLSKDVIADRLWDGEPPPSAMGTLESYVSNLRRAMGSTGRRAAVATTAQGYVLSDDVQVDVSSVRSLLRRAAGADDAERARLVEQAVDLQRGVLLADDRYSLWAEEARRSHDAAVVEACVLASRAATRTGDLERACRLASHAVSVDESAEVAWQLVLEALDAMGRRAEALDAYLRLRASMQERLGVEPSPSSREIYQRMLADDAGVRRGDPVELSTLVRLLRQCLSDWPGVEVPEQDSQLTEVAARVLASA